MHEALRETRKNVEKDAAIRSPRGEQGRPYGTQTAVRTRLRSCAFVRESRTSRSGRPISAVPDDSSSRASCKLSRAA